MIEPLANLAEIAHLVGQGNFDVKMTKTDSLDEVGVVTRAFNTMVESLGEYVVRTKEKHGKRTADDGKRASDEKSSEGGAVKISAVTDQSSFSL